MNELTIQKFSNPAVVPEKNIDSLKLSSLEDKISENNSLISNSVMPKVEQIKLLTFQLE